MKQQRTLHLLLGVEIVTMVVVLSTPALLQSMKCILVSNKLFHPVNSSRKLSLCRYSTFLYLSLLDENKHLRLLCKYFYNGAVAICGIVVPLNVQQALSKILHDKLDGKTFSQCQAWKSKCQPCRRSESNNSYGKYLLAQTGTSHMLLSMQIVLRIRNGGGEGEKRIWFRGKKMCEERVTAEVCGPSLMQIAAIFLCLWLRFSQLQKDGGRQRNFGTELS